MDRLDEILPFIEQNKCVLFIGAGLSRIAGCYDWNTLVKKLLDDPVISNVDPDAKKLIGRIPNENLIDYCKKTFEEKNEEHKFWGIVRDAILFDPTLFTEKYLPLIKLIKKINPFPQIILTTNIDSCLEHSKEFDRGKVYFKPDDFVAASPQLPGTYHIHGFIESLESSLLTRKMYIPRYRNVGFQSFMKAVLQDNAAFFLGYQLQEQGITDILLEAKQEKPEMQHFLLAPEEDDLDPAMIKYHDIEYGVRTIKYGVRDDFQSALADWVARNFGTVLKEE